MSESEIKRAPSCEDDPAAGALSVSEARDRIAATLGPVSGTESVALRAALGRVLAEDVISPLDVPAHVNSAMDGYALRAEDLPAEGVRELTLVGNAWAGHPFDGAVQQGQAVRIMTGAKLPAGADTVVMQEHVEAAGERVRVGTGHAPGQNVRQAGEDIARGSAVLAPGHLLSPADLGLLASLGVAEVRVHRRPRVAFFSTGDELRSIGETLGEGDIYDSNRYTLYGMLTRVGVDVVDLGVVRDTREEIERAFREAAECADAVITSGGVSVGEADYVAETLQRVGDVGFWKIAMKPGRPLAFGRVGAARFFGLPGNPVAVMVTFYQFVRPALYRMMGAAAPPEPFAVRARCTFRIRKKPGRSEFPRARLERTADGSYVVGPAGSQGSGVLSVMSAANCFILLPAEGGTVESGAEVEVQPFQGLI